MAAIAPFLSAIMFLGLLLSRASASPEQEFWSWFQAHESALYDYRIEKQELAAGLSCALHRVDKRLTYEFGPTREGKREFVISADGIQAAFPAVFALHAAAPKLPRWSFVRFRPRCEPLDVVYEGVQVRAREVRFVLYVAPGRKVDIDVYMPGEDGQKSQKLAGVAFLLLDHALGEFDVETKVGGVEVRPLAEAPPDAFTVEELGSVFDRSWSASNPSSAT